MFRKLVLAAALVVGAFAANPAPASAQGVYIGVGGPGYHRGYDRPRYGYDRPRYGYDRPRYRPYRAYERPAYRPRVYGYYGGGPRYQPRCRVVTRRYWDGYRYVTRSRETCGRRW